MPESSRPRAGNGGIDWPIEREGGQAASCYRQGGGDPNPDAVLVVYGDEVLGELSWYGQSASDPSTSTEDFEQLAHQLAHRIHRNRLLYFSGQFLKRELALVGVSEELARVEDFIERAASVDLPVLIDGEFGTEKVQVACALHYASRARSGPLVEIRCLSQQPGSTPDPSEWFEQAVDGTLLLNGLDDLHPEIQARVSEFLESRVGQWIGNGMERAPAVRLISTATRDLRELMEQGRFSEALFAELNFLTVRLPPLRKRRCDIPHLTRYILERSAHPDGDEAIESGAMELLSVYDWPQNVFELERVMGRLLAMRGRSAIRHQDIVNIAPRLVVEDSQPDHARGRQASHGRPSEVLATAGSGHADGDIDSVSVEWLAKAIVEGELGELKRMHISVRRALEYIGQNFQEEITLGELADAAGVSPSHLCYLFKSSIGITFKTLLGMVRVEKAKQLLVENLQHRITDISLDVGFGDLSHFEKTFKRLLKVSPREYRRRRMGELRS